MQANLESFIFDAIEKLEKQHDYQFETFEVDNVLLDIVKRNHEKYINLQFKE